MGFLVVVAFGLSDEFLSHRVPGATGDRPREEFQLPRAMTSAKVTVTERCRTDHEKSVMIGYGLVLVGFILSTVGVYYGPVRGTIRRAKVVRGRGLIHRNTAGLLSFVGPILVIIGAFARKAGW